MVGSKCNLKTHVQYLGYSLPYKSGSKNHLFGRHRKTTSNLTAYILGIKHGIHKRVSALQAARGLLSSSRNSVNFGPQTASNLSEFSPTFRKFCIPLYCQASEMEISKWNSTKLCQTVDGRPR